MTPRNQTIAAVLAALVIGYAFGHREYPVVETVATPHYQMTYIAGAGIARLDESTGSIVLITPMPNGTSAERDITFEAGPFHDWVKSH